MNLPPLIAIDDPDDPRIAGYRNIRERDLVGRQGLFIVEGEVVLRVLAASRGFEAVSVLVDPKRAEKLGPILSRMRTTAVYAASQPVLDAIAGFHLHRGILALARRTADPSAESLLAGAPMAAVVLALFGIANHDNMGGLFRNAAAFGAHAVLLDGASCDPLYRKAIRVSVGGVLTVPFARFAASDDPVALLQSHGFQALALSPRADCVMPDLAAAPRAALLLGAEGPGLPASILERATGVAIPIEPGFDSLNVATSAAIALYHLKFARTAAAPLR